VTGVRVQIYTMQSVEEALAVAALGVDHIGVTPTTRPLPGAITLDEAARICDALRGTARSVALSVEGDVDEIAGMVGVVEPDILHLCALPGAITPATIEDLRDRLPGVAVMHAVAVGGPESIDDAVAFAAAADYLILDTLAPGIGGIGAAGEVHDWEVSAQIVAAVDTPVVLAGGLSPENVAGAVARVRPWGVDSLTHTNRPLPGGGFRKDLKAVAAFVAAARGEHPA
jgi:phosphoribosylanthranilate isomerase